MKGNAEPAWNPDDAVKWAFSDEERAALEAVGSEAKAVCSLIAATSKAVENFDAMCDAYLDKEIQGRPPIPPEAE